MRKLKLDKNIILIAALSAALIAEIIFLSLGLSAIFKINKKISQTRQALSTIEREWPDKNKYIAGSESLKKEIGGMRDKFILPQQESALFAYISSESKNFGVQIKAIKPLAPQEYASGKLGSFKCLPIEITATGSFHDFAQFLDLLQNGKYFFDVTQIQFSSDIPHHSIEIVICALIKEN